MSVIHGTIQTVSNFICLSVFTTRLFCLREGPVAGTRRKRLQLPAEVTGDTIKGETSDTERKSTITRDAAR